VKRVKGCVNKACIANKKNLIYKESDDFCSKCGSDLSYICKKCHTQLPDNSNKFCIRCSAEIQDQKDRALKIAGATAMTVGTFAIGPAKKAIKILAKMK